MIYLTSTSDQIQIITGGTQAIQVHASYVDLLSSGIATGRTNTLISSATTTAVVPSPGASIQRDLVTLSVCNTDASVADTVTVQHTDGTNVVVLISCSLPAGYTLTWSDEIGWVLTNSSGGNTPVTTATRVVFGSTNNNPTTSANLTWTDSTQTLGVGAAASAASVTFGAAVTAPSIVQTAPATDVATVDMAITPQAAFSGASTHVSPGNLRVNLTAPVSGTAEAALVLYRGASAGMALGQQPGSAGFYSIWFGSAASARTNANCAITGNNVTLYIQPTTSLVITAPIISFNFWMYSDGNGFYLSAGLQGSVGQGSGGGCLSVGPAYTNPTTNPANNGGLLYLDKVDLNFKTRDSVGTQYALTPKSTGTVNTQAQKILNFSQYGRISTSGNTLTLTIPLATSTTNCNVTATALIKVATLGSGTVAGDSFILTVAAAFKNVGGTLTQLGATTTIGPASASDASLSTSTVAFSVSGTNIVITITAKATSGTLGNADCTINAVQIIN